MEPPSKRKRGNQPETRASLQEGISETAIMTSGFSQVFYSLLDAQLKARRTLNFFTNADSTLAGFVGRGLVDTDILKSPTVKNIISANKRIGKAIQSLVKTQRDLVHETYAFMQEAAILLGIGYLNLDKEEVLKFALQCDGRISRRNIEEYLHSSVTYHLVLDSSPVADSEAQQALAGYLKLSKRMLEDRRAAKVIQALWSGFKRGQKQGAFSALCVPSGTGKTQLAFCLPDVCQVLYLNMSLRKVINRQTLDRDQPIYRNFREYMWFIAEKIGDDMKLEGTVTSLWIYGIVSAFLEVLEAHPDLSFPHDLARMKVVRNSTSAGAIAIKPMLKSDTITRIKRFESARSRTVLFFLDEFTADKIMTSETLAFFRRCLMDLEACVVVASTDSGAANMLNLDAATSRTRDGASGHERPWVQVATRLPSYVLDPDLVEDVRSCPPDISELISLCLKSRPLFACESVDLIRKFLIRRRPEVMQFIEQIRERLMVVMDRKRESFQIDGAYGFVLAMLLSDTVLSTDPRTDERKLHGNMSTKNWAYLVNEKALRTKAAKRATDLSPSVIESFGYDELFLTLFRLPQKEERDSLCFKIEESFEDYLFSTFFPKPEHDFLLSLVLAGSSKYPGLKIVNLNGRISTAKLINSALSPTKEAPGSEMPRWRQHEAIVCAAFMVASNSGPISGTDLETFLTRFVSELVSAKEDFVQLQTAPKITWQGDFKAQFMFPYNSNVPSVIHRLLGSVQSVSLDNKLQFDGGCYDPQDDKKLKTILEAKSGKSIREDIRKALSSQDEDAKVSFIVLKHSLDKLTPFRLEEFNALNRRQTVHGKFQKMRPLRNSVLFKVEIQGRQVILKHLSEKKENPDRLIFLISVSDINSQVMKHSS